MSLWTGEGVRMSRLDYEKQMCFLMDYYNASHAEIGEMCLSLNNMSLERFYDLTLAGYEYKDGVMIEPLPVNFDAFGLVIE